MNTDYHIYVIFPHTQERLCEFITQHIIDSFDIICEAITYDCDKINIKKIKEIIEEQCILIIGYEGNISHENCYKLGMAHAKSRIVILTNILPNQDIYLYKENPDYIRKHFFIIFQSKSIYKDELKKITKKLEDIINIILINDFSSILYMKAIDWCNRLETKTKTNIMKLDRNLFNLRLIKYEEYFLKKIQKKLFDLYLEDDKYLYKILLECICEDKFERMEIEELAKSEKQSQLIDNSLPTQKKLSNSENKIICNINIGGEGQIIKHDNSVKQYGKGDNFAGDEVEGNKIG
jgi:hypothetical protein